MNPNAKYLALFSKILENKWGEDFVEIYAKQAKAVKVLTMEDGLALQAAAMKFHFNKGESVEDDALEVASEFALVMVEHGQEFKEKHGAAFDVDALVKTLASMMTNKMDRINAMKLRDIKLINAKRYKRWFMGSNGVVPYAVMPRPSN